MSCPHPRKNTPGLEVKLGHDPQCAGEEVMAGSLRMTVPTTLMGALCLVAASGWACADQVLPAPPELASGYR
ncbi:protein of unknown function, partial [Pseudomonas inefficax]